MKAWLLLLALAIGSSADAQDDMTWDEFVEYASTDENAEAEGWADYIEGLYEMHLHPVDVNSATLEDLYQLPILNQRQAEDIKMYVLRYGEMKTLGELLAITSIDADMRRILPLFICANEPEEAHRRLRFSDSRHTMLTRLDIRAEDDTDDNFRGRGAGHRLRYGYAMGSNIQAGFGVEKDIYEPMTFKMGYDHWSGYAMAKNVKWLRAAVVGDYRLGWGCGLLVNNRFSMGKSAFSVTTPAGVAGHSSTAESNFLRGVAATVGNETIQATPFFSCRLIDARYDSQKQATSLSSSGMHRTDGEIRLRHTQRQVLAGAHVSWRVCKALELAATAFGERYSMPFTRGTEAYKRFYPEGTDFWGASADYSLRLGKLSMQGELATDGNGVATVNHFTWRESRRLSVTASQRYYSPAFHSFLSGAFCESAVQNEHGYYLSALAEPGDGWTLRAYADFFFRPYRVYRVDHASKGQDIRLQAAYSFNAGHTLEAKAQWKHKEAHYALYVSQKYALAHTFEREAWRLRTQVQVHHFSTATGSRTMGYSLQPSLRYQSGAWRAAMAVAYCNTGDYYSRVYLAQPSLTGTRNLMFYGRGVAASAMVRYTCHKWLKLSALYAVQRGRHDISLQLEAKL